MVRNTPTSTPTSTPIPPTVTPTVVGTPCPAPFTCTDVGATGVTGSTTYTAGVYTVRAGGADIDGTAGAYHYAYQTVTGDGTISGEVLTQADTAAYAKAGFLYATSATTGTPLYALTVSPVHGIEVEYRPTQGATTVVVLDDTAGQQAPIWLEIGRVGTTYTSYTSADGATWTPVAGSAVTIAALSGTETAGMVADSHVAGTLGTIPLVP